MVSAVTLSAVCFLGLALTLMGEYRKHQAAMLIGKLVAASAYVVFAVLAGAWTSDWGRVLLVGMLFCWAGDLLLVSQRRQRLFLAGLVAFLIGHIFYSMAFVVRGVFFQDIFWTILWLFVFAFLTRQWLRPHLSGMMVMPVHVYLAAILVMWLLAIATHAAHGGLLLLIGASLFVISDLSVARNRFIRKSIINRLWGMPAYFCGQMLLAWSVSG